MGLESRVPSLGWNPSPASDSHGLLGRRLPFLIHQEKPSVNASAAQIFWKSGPRARAGDHWVRWSGRLALTARRPASFPHPLPPRPQLLCLAPLAASPLLLVLCLLGLSVTLALLPLELCPLMGDTSTLSGSPFAVCSLLLDFRDAPGLGDHLFSKCPPSQPQTSIIISCGVLDLRFGTVPRPTNSDRGVSGPTLWGFAESHWSAFSCLRRACCAPNLP